MIRGCVCFWQVLLHVWTHRETSAGHGGRRQIGGGCGGALVPSECLAMLTNHLLISCTPFGTSACTVFQGIIKDLGDTLEGMSQAKPCCEKYRVYYRVI